MNECVLGEAECHENATCSDVVGEEDSYICTCKPGFTGDGFSSCVGKLNKQEQIHTIKIVVVIACTKYPILDINECEMGENKCSENATCSNLAGSYSCTCKPGFTGDGMSCVGKTKLSI